MKVARKEGTKGQVRLVADKPPRGITVKLAPILPDKAEATITITAQKQAPVGPVQNIIVTGTLKVGKSTFTAVVPAIPVKVVAPPKPKPKPKK